MKAKQIPIKTAVVFPGQGSNILGAGKALIDAWPEALNRLEYYSMVVDMDIKPLLVREPLTVGGGTEKERMEEELVNVHLAMVSYGILAFDWLTRVAGYTPDMVAGHSLGEITALACAKVISPEDALILARARGRLLAGACRETSGAMTAFMGKKLDEIRQGISQWRKDQEGSPKVFEANVNGAEQLVISGNAMDLNGLEQTMVHKGVRARRLSVAGAFHSPFMGKASGKLFKVTSRLRFYPPEIPVISSVTGRMLTEVLSLPVWLSLQLVKPVEWVRVMERMEKAQIGSFIEVAGERPVLLPLTVKQKNWPVRCVSFVNLLKQSAKGNENGKQF